MKKQSLIKIKTIPHILVASIHGRGKIKDLNKDIDKLYEYIYKNNYQDKITGPTIALFYTKSGSKYIAAVPIKEKFPTKGKIKIRKLPKIKCVSIIHREGNIENSYNRLFTYIKKYNLNWSFPVREIYIPRGKNKYTVKYIIEIQIPIKASI
jgi:effector-binding domain-containing protein